MLYTIKLVSYRGMPFGAYIFDTNNKRFETTDYEYALKVLSDYEKRNPDGFYIIEKLNVE